MLKAVLGKPVPITFHISLINQLIFGHFFISDFSIVFVHLQNVHKRYRWKWLLSIHAFRLIYMLLQTTGLLRQKSATV